MRVGKVILETVLAIAIAAGVSAGSTAMVTALDLPDNSWLPTTAMATLVVFLSAAALAIAAIGQLPRWVHVLTGIIAPAASSAVHQAFVLHGTPHYLNGLGGDQLNRVAYLNRFADSPALADAFYRDLAPFYPAGWFWLGGRLSALTGIPAWEFYKPFAIATMALAGSLAFIAWRRLVGNRLATPLALVTASIGVALAAYEPYSWLFIALLPALAIWAQRLTNPRYLVTVTLYLGLAAISYTLIAAIAALLTTACAAYTMATARAGASGTEATRARRRVLAVGLALLVAAVGSALIALLFWWPYLSSLLRGAPHEASVATDFAPEIAASWPLPMLELSTTGLLSMIGLVWLAATVAHRAQTTVHPKPVPGVTFEREIAVGLSMLTAIGYLWFAASGIRALMQSTLLPFRLTPVITLALVIAGVFGLHAVWRLLVARNRELSARAECRTRQRQLRWIGVAVAAVLAVNMAQHVSAEDTEFADNARAAGGEPEAIVTAIADVSNNTPANELVVLSGIPSLYSFQPYWAFQAPAAAYASPAGTYEARNAAIRQWSTATTGTDLLVNWDADEFAGPDVLVLNRRLADGAAAPDTANPASDADNGVVWVFDEVVNTMPEKSNIMLVPVTFDPRLFANPQQFAVREVGPFVVIGRR